MVAAGMRKLRMAMAASPRRDLSKKICHINPGNCFVCGRRS
ncbi:hypothetical protein [Neobacillus sp. Marseille-QA0830]